ncbi:MAG: PD-(D/E)XK nuclease family protein [Candidatus Cloacimonadales bacterium]|nr:PD-(D/E)XK nuclease family protein [Candidatus Cloacimonadota bacterium]MDD2650229.1 PD-(D/E)XK nuclease family protein [Candidatus Cloacimonadota bacterium]MDX9977895.1 PD-(D/E)XK nuclease family protein [Candidatus Cloacimonadales bacterium]
MYFKNLSAMKQELLMREQRDTLIICQDYAQQHDLLKVMQNKWGLVQSRVVTKQDFDKLSLISDKIMIEDIKRYISFYAAIPKEIKEKYKLITYKISVEFLNNALNLFEELKQACKTIDCLIDNEHAQDWQIEAVQDLIIIYNSYREYLAKKGFTDAIYLDISNFNAQPFSNIKKIIFYNIVEFSALDKEIFNELMMNGLQIEYFVQGDQKVFDLSKLKLIESINLDLPNKEIKLFQAKNAFGTQRQLLNEIKNNEIDRIIDFDIDKQSFYQELNPEYFQISQKLNYNHSAVFRLIDQVSDVLEEMEEDRGKKLITVHSIYHWFANSDLWQYLGKLDDASLSKDVNRFFLHLNATNWIYLDLAEKGGIKEDALNCREKKLLTNYFTEDVQTTIDAALEIIRVFLSIKTFDELLDYLIDWDKNKLLPLFYWEKTDTEKQYLNHPEIDTFLQSIDYLKSIIRLGLPHNIDEVLPSTNDKLKFIIEYLRGKSFKTKNKQHDEKRIMISEFSDPQSSFDENIAVLNLQESVLPSVRKVPYLLTNQQRQDLGLNTWDDTRRLEKYQLYCLLNNCKTAHLFYYENEDENTQRSSFIEELLQFRKDIKPELLDDIGYEEYFNSIFKKNNEFIIPDKGQLDNNEFYAVSKSYVPETLNLGYYSWSAFINNSFNWYFDQICYFSVFQEIKKPHLSYITLGNLVHNVMDKLIKQKLDIHLLKEESSEKIVEEYFDQELENMFYYKIDKGFDGQFFNRFLKESLSKNIVKFIKQEFDMENNSGYRDIKTEDEFESTPLIEDFVKININGRVDLIVDYNDSTVITDIKTGSHNKEQLEFYLYLWHLVNPNRNKDIKSQTYNVLKHETSAGPVLNTNQGEDQKIGETIKDKTSDAIEVLKGVGLLPSVAVDRNDNYKEISRQKDFIIKVKKDKEKAK